MGIWHIRIGTLTIQQCNGAKKKNKRTVYPQPDPSELHYYFTGKIDVGIWPPLSSSGRRIIVGSFYRTV